ncbi:hypothetical protein CROQUDRAFT_657961 [Cronartium quercuum f. sp. fusiforme G11]|uniref:50S ribosomal protein L22, chloroplastic n=1 Tax=Cronartium quercuum f. sp. fusiforme G11 TaxID=708437 RepID=A0A9P6NI31_9BASI|nr:hypothetical protein CROQUDRAFT_657961 [Cronartium quercuum f. sp. fusiforme G11]
MMISEIQKTLVNSSYSSNQLSQSLLRVNSNSIQSTSSTRAFSRTAFRSTNKLIPKSPRSSTVSTPDPKVISALRRQALTNADSTYDSLPPVTSGFDSIKLTQPQTLLKPRLHLSSFPKLGLKLTRPAKDTQSYGLNFGVLPRPTLTDRNPIELTKSGREEQVSLIDRTLLQNPPKTNSELLKRNPKECFGSVNNDPSCHKASTPLLPISHKKLQKLADLINRYRMTVDEAKLQLKFSHKAIASKVLDLVIEARDAAVARGLKSKKLVIAEAWVTKGFHTTELQVRARGRHGQITHPTSKFCIILRESESRSTIAKKTAFEDAKRRVRQRGIIPGASWRLPADGVIPTSIGSQAHWGW